MGTSPLGALPPELLARASCAGNELAWCVNDIPSVIEAARAANLVSIGGQLQFRLPDGGVCECYWIEVDTYRSVDKASPWTERVEQAAVAAYRDFAALQDQFDFVAEGRKAFAKYLDEMVANGHNPADAMCFVWYVLGENEALANDR